MTIQTKINGLLGLASRARELSFGLDSTIEAISKEKAKLVIIANDVSKNTAEKIKQVCEKNNIQYIYFGSIKENSNSIGKENKAIISVNNNNFALAILKIINNGGDVTGE